MEKRKITAPKVKGFKDIEQFAKGVVDITNWTEYPHKPKTEFALAHTDEALLVCFDVEEPHIVGLCTQTHGDVYKDSCVEFFVREPQAEHYFNFEINCIGTILAARRKSRTEKEYFTDNAMQQIKVASSLQAGVPFEGEGHWSIELEIPFKMLDLDSCPEHLEANFYKCGDETPIPHFVSWSPIATPTPDFHRPEFFGEIELQ